MIAITISLQTYLIQSIWIEYYNWLVNTTNKTKSKLKTKLNNATVNWIKSKKKMFTFLRCTDEILYKHAPRGLVGFFIGSVSFLRGDA